MPIIITYLLYVILFIFTYVQVFMLVTLFERNDKRNIDEEELKNTFKSKPDTEKPSVTVVVPVFNEETTVFKTVESLLKLNYPKDKLSIMVVDDGSKDNTWNIIQDFKDNPQVLLHQKENGGKYTAVNYGIEMSKSEFVGCLDADSAVDSEALNYMMPHFADPTYMVVTPSMRIENPDTFVRMMQNAEYKMSIFIRKVLNLLDAQYVTPGPFSIFRKSVFNDIGKFKHAHNTEDLEIALRLQSKHYIIANAEKAIVFTVGPRSVYKLYRQRVRWTSGFLQNSIDYRRLIFNPAYSNLGMFILPLSLFSILVTIFSVIYSIINTISQAIKSYKEASATGWDFSYNFLTIDWWYYNIQTTSIIGFFVILVLCFAIWYGHITTRLTTDDPDSKRTVGVWTDALFFVFLYSFISPFWIFKSVWNTISKREASWR